MLFEPLRIFIFERKVKEGQREIIHVQVASGSHHTYLQLCTHYLRSWYSESNPHYLPSLSSAAAAATAIRNTLAYLPRHQFLDSVQFLPMSCFEVSSKRDLPENYPKGHYISWLPVTRTLINYNLGRRNFLSKYCCWISSPIICHVG